MNVKLGEKEQELFTKASKARPSGDLGGLILIQQNKAEKELMVMMMTLLDEYLLIFLYFTKPKALLICGKCMP